MIIRYTLCADERLKREQHIQTLFRSGKAFSVFPLRIIWLAAPRGAEKYPVRAGVSVSKRNFKKAVDRNRIKRLLRESWRLQKHDLYPLIPADMQIHLFIIYTGKELPDYDTVFQATGKGITRITAQLMASTPAPDTAAS